MTDTADEEAIREPWRAAEAEGMRGWLATRYVNSPPVWTAPESGGLQPQIHHDLDDPLLHTLQFFADCRRTAQAHCPGRISGELL